MDGMWEWMGPMMVLMWVIGAILVIAVIVGIVVAVRSLIDRDRGARSGSDDAVRILEQRYARGEIDHEEFVERRDTLRDRG